jgi:hypothetical protein
VRSSQTNEVIEMTIGAALLVIVVGVLIAMFASSTIGWIVAAIGIVGLIIAALTTGRRGRVVY